MNVVEKGIFESVSRILFLRLFTMSNLVFTSKCIKLHQQLEDGCHLNEQWFKYLMEAANIYIYNWKAKSLANEYLAVGEHFLAQVDDGQGWKDELVIELNILWLQYFFDLMKCCAQKHLARTEVQVAKSEAKFMEEQIDLHFPSDQLKNIPLKIFEPTYNYNEVIAMFKYVFVKTASARGREDLLTSQRSDIAWRLCEMYDILIYFEKSARQPNMLGRVAKMQKRKLDLNLQLRHDLITYKRTKLERRPVQFQIGKVLYELLATKMSQFERTCGKLNPKLLQKMAYLCTKGIDTFTDALVLANLPANQRSLPRNMLLKDKVYCIQCWFYIARFHNKFFTPNRKEQLKYTKKAICFYECVVAGTKANEDTKESLGEELRISVETADLLKRQVKKNEEPSPYQLN